MKFLKQEEILKSLVTEHRSYNAFEEKYNDIPFKDFDLEGWIMKEQINRPYEISTSV